MLERDPFHSSLISSGNAVTDTPCNDGRQHLGSCDRTHSKMRYRSVSGAPSPAVPLLVGVSGWRLGFHKPQGSLWTRFTGGH